MHPLDRALMATSATLAALVLAGLCVSRKLRVTVLFPVYLGTAAVVPFLLAVWPGWFWNWPFLAATRVFQAMLRLGIAFELAHLTFRPLPRGYARVGWILVIVTFALVPVVAWVPRDVGDAFDLARAAERLSYGTSALFLVYLGAARFYRVPLDPLHRVIATGLGVVTLVVAGCVTLLWRFDPLLGLGRDAVAKLAYPCILAWWARAAWRRDDFSGLSPETLRRLHPWRLT